MRTYRRPWQTFCNTKYTEDSGITITECYSTVFVKLRQWCARIITTLNYWDNADHNIRAVKFHEFLEVFICVGIVAVGQLQQTTTQYITTVVKYCRMITTLTNFWKFKNSLKCNNQQRQKPENSCCNSHSSMCKQLIKANNFFKITESNN